MHRILNFEGSILGFPYGANLLICCCRFTVGQETAAFLASCEILFNAWEESGRANNSESYSLKEHGGVAYVAFPSFLRIESFIDGEGNIKTNNQVFSDCLKGYDDKPA